MQDYTDEQAERRVLLKYDKLYKSLRELVSALNVLEPGGTLVDDIVITQKEGKKIRLAYVATPIQLTINTPERKFILKVIEGDNGDRDELKVDIGRIEKQHKNIVEQPELDIS